MTVAVFTRTTFALMVAGLVVALEANAQQGAYAYPNAGQTEAQQSQDRFECHQWAVSQSGFDPSTAPPLASAPAVPPPPPGGYADQQQQSSSGGLLGIGNGGMFQGGGMMGDAATGAALGAAGGAIAGNAGEGAAIGAVASTLFGALNRSTATPAPAPAPSYDAYQQQAQAQSAQQYNQRMQLTGEYNRAFGACMSARNYTVN